MNKKKLVQINVTCNGSTGKIMEQIQKVAQQNGYEAISFYGRGKPSNDKCIKIGNCIDIYWNVFLTRIFDRHGYGSKRATRQLVKKIRDINPDIIQLHNIHGYYLNLKILFEYLKEANIPIVWTLHDCWAFTGHCVHFETINCNKWQEKCKDCIQKQSYPKSIFMDNSEKQFELKKKLFTSIRNLTIITPSEWLAKLVKKSFFKEYEVKVINNGINLDIFKSTDTINIREKYNIPRNKRIILGVASVWNKKKGLEDFLELAKTIDKETIILLVGLNKKMISQLPENIIGIQKIENIEELANIYTVSDVFANPTHEDNFPTTNLESLACGTPVVTYNTGGSAECINERLGGIVDSYDVNKLKNEIDLVIDKNLDTQTIIQESQKYDSSRRYKEYMRIYREIFERKLTK